jgi:hypothetical protein
MAGALQFVIVMKKTIVSIVSVSFVLAFAASVLAAQPAPSARPTDGSATGPEPVACWVKGTMCHSPADCCHHSCSPDSSSFHHMRCD